MTETNHTIEMMARYDSAHHIVIVEGEEEGAITTENVKKATGLAVQLSKAHRSNLLLFDISKMKLGQSALQGFLDMKNMGATTGLTIENKCAVVYNPANYPIERAEFIETVVTNRPNPAFKMFKTRKEAIQWLKEL